MAIKVTDLRLVPKGSYGREDWSFAGKEFDGAMELADWFFGAFVHDLALSGAEARADAGPFEIRISVKRKGGK